MIGGEISVTIIVFILNYIILEKTNDKVFQKIRKTLFWGHLGKFLPKFGENVFSWKKGSEIEKNHGAKNLKKLTIHS